MSGKAEVAKGARQTLLTLVLGEMRQTHRFFLRTACTNPHWRSRQKDGKMSDKCVLSFCFHDSYGRLL